MIECQTGMLLIQLSLGGLVLMTMLYQKNEERHVQVRRSNVNAATTVVHDTNPMDLSMQDL
jgi:hypothetical protein